MAQHNLGVVLHMLGELETGYNPTVPKHSMPIAWP